MSIEPSHNKLSLPSPSKERSRSFSPMLAASGFCLLPALLQVMTLAKSDWTVGTAPTDAVVEALSRSVMPPVFAHTKQQLSPLEQPLGAIMQSQLQRDGKSLFLGSVGDRDRAIECLALAAWYEAGNDDESQRSVMQVVLNRVAHPSFPKSVCGVVFQGSKRSTGCQFTFTCDGSMLRRRPPAVAMVRARALAAVALQATIFPSIGQATHYHADYVMPWWASKLVPRGKVGRHIFYSWPGKLGLLQRQPKSTGEDDLALLVNHSASRQVGLSTRVEPNTVAPAAAMRPPPETIASPVQASSIAPSPAKTSSTIMLVIDTESPNGRWAVLARSKCAGKAGCRVLGYAAQDQIVRNSAASASSREKPIFLFIRDDSSGIELALWDCEKADRPASSQCLPGPGRELARLLRDSQN